MASKSKYIGYGTSILTISALIVWFMLSPDFQVEYSGDIECLGTLEEPCISFINVTFTPQNPIYKYFYVYNRDGVKLDFSPDITQYALCKPDGRYKKERSLDNLCGPGYREIFTQPYYYKYSYYYKFYKNQKEEWMLVGLKNNPTDKVKWGMNAVDTYIDPVWDSKEEDKPDS